MIASDKHNPIVGVVHPLAIAPDDILIIPLLRKPKAAITGHDEQGVSQLVLSTELVHEEIEVTMDVTRNNDALCFGELESE